MRRVAALLVLLALCLVTAGSAPVSLSPQDYLGHAIGLLRQYSIDRDTVDWAAVAAEARRRAAGATTPAGTYSAIRYVIQALGNPHTVLYGPARTQAPPPDTIAVPHGETLGDVAMLTVPAFKFDADGERRYVAAGEEAVQGVDAHAPCGWIVDLRHNGGGDMWPMLTVLAPLLDDGALGSFVDGGGVTSPWTLRDGRLLVDGKPQAHEDNPLHLRRPRPPVAVLTSPATASSGEATLIAFRGLGRAATFGQATAGYATGNEVFPLADGAQLVITTVHDVDRTGRVYGNTPIAPDHALSDHEPPDGTVRVATAWLHDQPGCAHR